MAVTGFAGNVETEADKSLPPEILADMHRVVRILAGRLHARLPPDCGIEVADLVQAGTVGLLQAVRKYEPARGAPLAGFAKFRIRGEMLEVVRRSAESARWLGNMSQGREDYADVDSRHSGGENSPQTTVLRRQRAQIIGEELRRLPPRYRTVVRLRYSREMTLRQIGAELRVNESRVCQIHQNALSLLKRALKNRGVRGLSHL